MIENITKNYGASKMCSSLPLLSFCAFQLQLVIILSSSNGCFSKRYQQRE